MVAEDEILCAPRLTSSMNFNRYKAFGLHLLGSLSVALLTSALVFLVWYPGLFASATGVTSIFLIVLGVDVVMGPLITLIVFNPAKKELRRDLVIVLVLQIAALAYGLHTVWIARPVYQVFNAGRFDLVLANDISDEMLTQAPPEFQALPMLGPKLVGAKAPDDRTVRKEILFSSLTGGGDLPQMVKYYVPYAALKGDILTSQRPLDKLFLTNNSAKTKEIEALQKRYLQRSVGFVPLKGKTKDLTVVIDAQTAEVLEMVALEPW